MSETVNRRVDAQDFQSYRGAIEAKPRKPVEELNRFIPYIRSLKRDEVKQVLPVFVAAIKKNPDDAISTFLHFLAHAKFDASPFLLEFFNVLKDHLQSKYEAVAKDALASFQSLVRSTRDAAVLLQVATELLKVPSGSLPAARRAWADALLELGSSSHLRDVPGKLIKEISDKLVPLVKKETNQDTLQSLLLSLGSWLAHSQEAIPPTAIALFEEGLVDEKNFDRIKHFLRALSLIVDRLFLPNPAQPSPPITPNNSNDASSTTTATSTGPTPKSGKAKSAPTSNNNTQPPSVSFPPSAARDSVEKLAKTLFTLLTKTKAKATARGENTLLFYALMNFARSNKTVEQQAEKEGIWTYFFSPQSFILSEGFAERLDVSAYPALYKIFGTLLDDWKKYKQLPASTSLFACIIASLVNEKIPFSLRKGVLTTIRARVVAWPALSTLLLDQFESNIAKAAQPANFANEIALMRVRSYYRSTLFAILPPSPEHVTLAVFEKLALLAHHRLVVCPLSASLFRKCLARIPNFALEAFAEKEHVPLIKDLYGEKCLLNSSVYSREASTEVIRSLVELVKSEDVIQALLQPLDALFEDTWSTLTEEDIAIYNTPTGTLYRQVKAQVVKYRTEEERWREEARIAKLAKEGKEDAKVKAEKDKILKEEAVVRDKVKTLCLKVYQAIHVVTVLSVSRPNLLNDILYVLMPRIVKLLPYEIHRQFLEEHILALYENCFKGWSLGRSIGIGLLVSFSTAPTKLNFKNDVISILLEELNVKITNERLLNNVQFGLLFPLLSYSLTTKQTAAVQHIAFQIIEKHIKNVHPPQLLELISVVIKTTKRLQQRGTAALLSANQKLEFKDGASNNLEVILDTFLSPELTLRTTAIDSLLQVPNLSEAKSDRLIYALWWGKGDSDYSVASKSNQLFTSLACAITDDYMSYLQPLLVKDSEELRQITSRSITAAIVQFPETYSNTQKQLLTLYNASFPTEEQSYDKEYCTQLINTRSAIITTLNSLGRLACTGPQVLETFRFILDDALPSETDGQVRNRILMAGRNITSFQGKAHLNDIMPVLLEYLQKSDQSTVVYEQVIVYVGLLSKHLISNNGEKEMQILKVLIKTTVDFDSQEIRTATLGSLAELISPLKGEGKKIIQEHMQILYSAKPQVAERRGYGYILAGLIKGVGIVKIMTEILPTVTTNLEGAVDNRLGSIFLIEGLLGERLFEPYLLHLINPILNCFCDKDKKVVTATTRLTKTLVASISQPALKLLLPAVLLAMSDKNSQKKLGATEMLSSLNHATINKLFNFLPLIVPKLASVLSDTSTKIVDTGKKGLKNIGAIIKNPEIQRHVPLLLNCIDDPNKYSPLALEALMDTKFEHHIDAASLSLIMPMLKRSLVDRNTDTKSRATKIVANICHLADHKDLKPYLEGIISEVQTVLLDPIPSTRATASKAIGALVSGMGESEFPNLIPWLLDTLQHNQGFIERNGAAQGLSEVISVISEAQFRDDLLPTILQQCDSEKPVTREGFISVFQYIPSAWGLQFASYLHLVLPCVTRRLADEVDIVRQAALKAGQAIVTEFAETATDKLIPTLQQGIFDDNWRIRQASVQLLGEFISRVMPADSDDTDVKRDNSIIEGDQGKRILAILYLLRSDPVDFVQNMASTTWKNVVENTPKTLKNIFPNLLVVIFDSLSSNSEKRVLGRDTLKDIVWKLGDGVIYEIVSKLEKNFSSPNPIVREGACVGLSEVLQAAGKQGIIDNTNRILSAVRLALSDSEPKVQEAAAKTFDILYSKIGTVIVDKIVPQLIANLESDDEMERQRALNGLKQLLAVRASIILPILIPKFVQPPMTSFASKALASMAEVSGASLCAHLAAVLPALTSGLYQADLTQSEENLEIAQNVGRVVKCVDENGLTVLMDQFLGLSASLTNQTRLGSIYLIGVFCESTELDLVDQIGVIIGRLLELYGDPVEAIQKAAINSVKNVLDKVPKEDTTHIVSINSSLDFLSRGISYKSKTIGSPSYLAGFCLPGGLDALLTLYLNGIRAANAVMRVLILEGIRLIISLTTQAALSKDLIKIIGPLIRIFSAVKLETSVKFQIIRTLNDILEKGGPSLRIAVTQLQTSYVKAITDTDKEVRELAAPGLAKLLLHGARVDFIIKELLRLLATNSDSAESIFFALYSLLKDMDAKLAPKPDVLLSLKDQLFQYLSDEEVRASASQCFGPYMTFLPKGDQDAIVNQFFSVSAASDFRRAHGHLTSLTSIISTKSLTCLDADQSTQQRLMDYITDCAQSDKIQVRQCVARLMSTYLIVRDDGGVKDFFVTKLTSMCEDSSTDVRVTALHSIKSAAKKCFPVFQPHLANMVPLILQRAKDHKVVRVKFAAERALYHLLQYYNGNEIVKSIAKGYNTSTVKELSEFCQKVLAKFERSEDEEEF